MALDISKAFYSALNSGLLHSLKRYVVSGRILDLIQCFLNHLMRMHLYGHYSRYFFPGFYTLMYVVSYLYQCTSRYHQFPNRFFMQITRYLLMS